MCVEGVVKIGNEERDEVLPAPIEERGPAPARQYCVSQSRSRRDEIVRRFQNEDVCSNQQTQIGCRVFLPVAYRPWASQVMQAPVCFVRLPGKPPSSLVCSSQLGEAVSFSHSPSVSSCEETLPANQRLHQEPERQRQHEREHRHTAHGAAANTDPIRQSCFIEFRHGSSFYL